LRVDGAETCIAEGARYVSIDVDLASETNAAVVVTGVEGADEAVRAGRTWRAGREEASLSAGET
jgi:hypothetical protein